MTVQRRHFALLTAVASVAAAAWPLPAVAQGSGPVTLKAAIVYNLSRFASWPPRRFASAESPVVLCVEASDPFAADLAAVNGRPVAGRRLEVRQTAWPFSSACHMAYVSPRRATAANLSALAAQGVITVGETPRFTDTGAVRLVVVGRQIRFEINDQVARSAGVQFSAQLLQLAVRVR